MIPQTRLDASYRAQSMKVRDRVLAYISRFWDRIGYYDDAAFDRMMAEAVPQVEAGQQRLADLTDAYVRRVSEIELGSSIASAATLAASTLELRGVDAATVFHRPFSSLYTALSKGETIATASKRGKERLLDVTSTGLQLSKTHSARNVMQRSRFTAYRRVLTGRENCALCVIASTQRYTRGNLMPIHPGCDCDQKPYDGPDMQVIDQDLLEQTQAAVEAKFGDSDRGARMLDGLNGRSDYLDLIITNEHSEIGPILGWRHQHFAGAKVLT